MASAELFISEQGLTCQYSATLRRRSPVPVCLLGCGSRPAEAAGHATARRTEWLLLEKGPGLEGEGRDSGP